MSGFIEKKKREAEERAAGKDSLIAGELAEIREQLKAINEKLDRLADLYHAE